jgi:alkylation response protein AidB-like acyl-CoA dehydrogenase
MDLELSADQVALRDGFSSLLTGRFGIEAVRAGFSAAAFGELRDAGVFSLIADGFSWSDAALVFELLGAACVPGPLITSTLRGTGAITGGLRRPGAGRNAVVAYLDVLEELVVTDAEGLWLIDPTALRGDPSPWPLDPLTPVTTLAAIPQGEQIGDPEAAAHWNARGAVLAGAVGVGIAQLLSDVSVAYAKSRMQFDRPIGSFQAMKHILADMAVRAELARAGVYAAAAHLDAPQLGGLDRAVAVAKTLAGEAAIQNGKAATQVHGGMGFTWEVDVHLYLKRAWVLDTEFGSVDEHADALAAALAQRV